jgi:hypothetical protein
VLDGRNPCCVWHSGARHTAQDFNTRHSRASHALQHPNTRHSRASHTLQHPNTRHEKQEQHGVSIVVHREYSGIIQVPNHPYLGVQETEKHPRVENGSDTLPYQSTSTADTPSPSTDSSGAKGSGEASCDARLESLCSAAPEAIVCWMVAVRLLKRDPHSH